MHIETDPCLMNSDRNGAGAARIGASVNVSVRLVGVDGAATILDVPL